MTTTLSAKGQILIPEEVREDLNLRAGDGFRVQLQGRRIILENIASSQGRVRIVRRKGRLPTILTPSGSGSLTSRKVRELERQMWSKLGRRSEAGR